MTTMVSIFARSARVAASSPLDTRALLAQPARAAANPNVNSKGRHARTLTMGFMRASIEDYFAALKRPGRADRQSVGVAELGLEALVLGTKRHAPVFGLHTHTVGEPVIGLLTTEVAPGTSLIERACLPDEAGHVGLQPCDAGIAEDIEEGYRQRSITHGEQGRSARMRIESIVIEA